MVRIGICFALAALCAALCARHSFANELGFPSAVFGADYETVITDQMLQTTPEWTMEHDNPPISARQAIKASGDVVHKLVKTPDDWQLRLDGITLSQSGNRWYWRAQYVWFPRVGGSSGLPPYLDVIVLMNGKAVAPTLLKKRDTPFDRD